MGQELLWDEVFPLVPKQDTRTKRRAEQTPFVHTQYLGEREANALSSVNLRTAVWWQRLCRREGISQCHILFIYMTRCFKNARFCCLKLFGDTNHLKHSQSKQKIISISFKSWLDQTMQYQKTQCLQIIRESADKIVPRETQEERIIGRELPTPGQEMSPVLILHRDLLSKTSQGREQDSLKLSPHMKGHTVLCPLKLWLVALIKAAYSNVSPNASVNHHLWMFFTHLTSEVTQQKSQNLTLRLAYWD